MTRQVYALLLLLSALTLTAAPAVGRSNYPLSNPCLLPCAPASCSKNLTLALGSVYGEQLTTNFPVNNPPTMPVYYWVEYNSVNCPYNSHSETDYFPVTVTYNNVTYTTSQYFIPTSSPQTLTVNLDLTNPTFPNCSSFPKPIGYLTSNEEFKAEQKAVAPKPGKEVPAGKPGSGSPYLSISTESPIGPGVVQAGGVVSLFPSGFMRGTPAEVRLDGKTVAQVKIAKDGRTSYTLKVGEELSLGQHRLEVAQKWQQCEHRAVATLVKVRGEDRFTEEHK